MTSNDGTPLKSPMPGKIVNYHKNIGDAVSEGDTVITIESMKMEMPIKTPVSGTVGQLNFKSGDSVAKDAVLCVIT